MITVLSFGITGNSDDKDWRIPCAYKDAEKVYYLFKRIFKNNFSSYNSLCINNVTKNNLRVLIETVIESINSQKMSNNTENQLIFYFSGHGHEVENELYLKLLDKSISCKELSYSFEEYMGEIIFILDCCNSGAAIKLANIESFQKKNNISIITSSDYYQTSSYNEEESEFTKQFCNAMDHLNENLEQISIKNIENDIRKQGGNCFQRTAYEKDVIFKQNNPIDKIEEITSKFCENIHTSDISKKEMLVYSIDNYPSIIKISILENLIDEFKHEGSWLIRRAFGSILCNCTNVEVKKRNFLSSAFKSNNWMLECIALIGIRNDIKDYVGNVKEIVMNSDVMDLTWLANLYYCDSSYKDINISLASKLSQTTWGVLEIYSNYSKEEKDAYKIISESISNKDLLKKIDDQISLEKDSIKGSLIEAIKDAKKRGKINRQENKWLISNLFGYWRNYADLDLKDYLENNFDDKIKNELSKARELPKYEMRMSIFQYFCIDIENGKKYCENLLWGIEDEHPWVKREAVEFFKDHKEIIKDKNIHFDINIDRSLYPGALDYYIVLVKYGFVPLETILKLELKLNEKKAIESYVNSFIS